jgi:hypothetical protein
MFRMVAAERCRARGLSHLHDRIAGRFEFRLRSILNTLIAAANVDESLNR